MKLAREDWPRMLALLEQALDLPAAEREPWLRGLDLSEALKAHLQGLLADRRAIETGEFLDELPAVAQPESCSAMRGRLVAGSMVGPYRLLRELGQGGMSIVWLAERADEQLRRQVALKLPHAGPGQELLARRLLRERNILAGLEHPNIARLYDVGVSESGMPFLVMEFVEGVDLLAWADARALSLRQRLGLFQQVLRAVQYAHGKLVLHRDLKPSNILVNAAGEVKLLDFGIAKVLVAEGESHDATELTRAAGQPLTLMYASPEQVLGLPLTTACDVYALGVLLYELLSGLKPYELKTSTAAETEAAVLHQEARLPSRRVFDAGSLKCRGVTARSLRKLLSTDLDAIALRALAKSAGQRYGSVEALHADIAHWLANEPVQARRPTSLYYLGKLVKRHRWGVSLGSMAMLAVLATGATAVVQGVLARQEAARAVAAKDFLLQMFEDTDPDRVAGAELSARQLLERGRLRAQAQLGGQARLQAELLSGIAKAQEAVSDLAGADATLAEVGRLLLTLKDPQAQASALLDRADLALGMQHLDDAERLLGDASALMLAGRAERVTTARWRKLRGFVALHRGEGDAARAEFEAYLAQIGTAWPGQTRETLDVRLALAKLASTQGRLDEADAQFQAATELALSDTGRAATSAATIAIYRVSADLGAGRYAHVLEWLPQSLDACDKAMGAGSELCWQLRAQYQRALLKTGVVEPALALVPNLLPMLHQQASPARRSEAAVALARVSAFAGRLPERTDAVEVLEHSVRAASSPPLSPLYRLIALNTLAEVQLLSARPTQALRWLVQAEAAGSDAGPAGNREKLKTRLFRGLALQSQGRHGDALQALAPFCDEATLTISPLPVLDRLFSLNCARSLAATGQTPQALALLRSALPVLSKGLGPEAPNVKRAERLLGELTAADSARSTPSGELALFI